MNLPNKPRVLAATYNPVSRTKMISFLVDFPTVLLAELRTHRILIQGSLYEHSELVDFNLSANSARAIPANKYLQKILDNPFIPIWTGKQSGMSGSVVTNKQLEEANHLWLEHLQSDLHDAGTAQFVEDLIELGIHKQNANRLLAPYAYTTCIISGTEWDNFFELRCPKYKMVHNGKIYFSKKEAIRDNPTGKNIETGENWSDITLWDDNDWLDGDMCSNISSAQPEFQVIAEMLYDLYQEANWKESKYHIPFEDEIDNIIQKYQDNGGDMTVVYDRDAEDLDEEWATLSMKISASMCAKLSYNTQDNEDILEKHLERANMLIEHKHAEPFSHQAIAMDNEACQVFTKSYLTKNKPNSINGSLIDIRGTVERYKGLYKVTEQGICYNLKGFISQRYALENL